MKKIYTGLVMLSVGCSAAMAQTAQQFPANKLVNQEKNLSRHESQTANGAASLSIRGNALWANSFDTPSDWTIDNEAGNSDDWVIGTAGPAGSFAIDPITSTSGGNFAMFDSDVLCSGDQLANLTTTNPIDLSGSNGAILEFEQYYRRFADLTYVLVSTDGTNWTQFEVNASLSNNDFCSGNPNLVQLNISSVAGGQSTVWIRFQFYSPSSYVPPAGAVGCAYAWMVDDVAIYNAPGNDLIVRGVIPGDLDNDYLCTKIPVSQASEVIFGTAVENFGTAEQNNVSLDWEITLDGSSVASGTQAAAVLMNSGQLDTVWVSSGYTPSAVGELEITVTASADEVEDVPANNELSNGFEVTEHVWGHDYEDEDYVGWGYPASDPDASGGFEAGARYFCKEDGDMIYALQFPLSSTTTSLSVTAKVYEDATTAGPVSETIYDIQAGDLSTSMVNFITVVLDDPVPMATGSVYTATVAFEAGDDAYILGNSIDDGDAGQAVYFVNDNTWYNWVGLTTAMRINLDATINIEENRSVSGVYIYPNPSSDVLNIGFVSKEDQNVTVNIIGVDGSIILTEQRSAKVGQSNLVTFDTSKLAAGMYMIQLSGANSSLTQRVVVQ